MRSNISKRLALRTAPLLLSLTLLAACASIPSKLPPEAYTCADEPAKPATDALDDTREYVVDLYFDYWDCKKALARVKP